MAGFNLNRNQSADYNLKERQIHEMITLYGVEVDFLKTTKMNIDSVLRDFSHLKIGTDKETIPLLPEDTQGWEGDMGFDMWGLHNQRTINFFISKINYEKIKTLAGSEADILNSIIRLPSGTVMEISDIISQVEGVNNLFTYDDAKSVYRLTTRVYNHSKQNKIEEPEEPTVTMDEDVAETFDDIDAYFKVLDNEELEDTGTNDAEVVSSVEDNVFGNLG